MKKSLKYLKTFGNATKLMWRSSRKFTILFILCNVVLGVYNPLLMIIWKYFVDSATRIISFGEKTTIFKAVMLLIIHCIILIAMDFTSQLAIYFQEMQRDYLNKYVLEITMDKISELDLKHFDNPEIYNKIEKVNSESTQRTVSLISMLVVFVRTITTLIGVSVILGQLNLFIIFICFGACIPIFIVNTKVSLKKYSLFNERMEKMRLVYSLKYLISKYENIKELKIFRLGKFIKDKVKDIYQKNLNEDEKIRRQNLKEMTIANIFQNIISYGFKLYVLMKVIINPRFTIGDLTMLISAIESFQTSAQNLLNTVSNLYVDALYLQNLFSLLEITVEKRGTISFDENFKEIIFEDVWFKYPNTDKYILEGICCKFQAGESYCIVGLNGAGKTTIIKLLTKLYAPSKGRIMVDGVDLQDISSETYFRNIGVIFQDYIKYPLSVSDNIGVGKIEEIDNKDLIEKSAKLTKAEEFILTLPGTYDAILQKEWSDGIELSLGQWQKIAISRAYMSESSIVILDEPTASLDVESEAEVYKQFASLMKEKMCVLVSHRLSVNKMVGHIYCLENGKIIEQGKQNELMKQNGKYAEYFSIQARPYIDTSMENKYDKRYN